MIKNCFNYVGSKDRFFEIIDKNLDKTKRNLIDVFCGSGVVGLNENQSYSKILLNDACWQVVETLKFFRNYEYEDILRPIKTYIKTFKLSKDNKEGFNKLRSFYNKECFTKETFYPPVFYCLVTHAFNYNIHINKAGEFNVPAGTGRSYFNPSLEGKLELFQKELHKNKEKISIKNCDYVDLIYSSEAVMPNSMFYCDPPYLVSNSSYNRVKYLGYWNEQKEHDLYECLDYINSRGGSFLVSNVLENNGRSNDILKEWSKKYNLIAIPYDYKNCNYQRKNNGNTVEVLVRNY